MSEQEWLECTRREPLLEFLWLTFCEDASTITERKARLLACGCCRMILHLLTDQRSKKALEIAEAFADGRVDIEAFHEASEGAHEAGDEALLAYESRSPRDDRTDAYHHIIGTRAASFIMLEDNPEDGVPILNSAIFATSFAVDLINPELSENEQASIVRDIFGNLFGRVEIDPVWNDGATLKLAQRIYAERAFAELPMLADALEKAGCTNAELLVHCRQPGPHVRGCWAVDLLLGKA